MRSTSQNTTVRVQLIAWLALVLWLPGGFLWAADGGILERRIDDVADVPAEARLALFEAQKEREKGNPEAAVDIISGFLLAHPDQDHFLVRFHLALSWARRGDLEEALSAYQASVAMEPLFAQGWLNLGELAYNMGQFDLAASALAKGYEVTEWKEPNVLFFAAAALVMDGRSLDAVPMLEELLSSAHGEPRMEWHRALIMAYLDLGDDEKGREALSAALSQHSDNPEAWRLGFRYFASAGDYEQAAIMLTIAGYLRPLSHEEEMTLGDLFLTVGVPAQASTHYASALAGGGSTQDFERLASAHLASYDFDAALAALDRALERDPTPRLWSLLGDLHFMRRSYEESYEAYRNCVEADSTVARAHLMMGYCAIQLERTADAVRALERAAGFPELGRKANQLLATVRSPAPQ
jgi:tetratricopeptide (TPR) repeat protein